MLVHEVMLIALFVTFKTPCKCKVGLSYIVLSTELYYTALDCAYQLHSEFQVTFIVYLTIFFSVNRTDVVPIFLSRRKFLGI